MPPIDPERLRLAMKLTGWTVTHLAEAVGLSRNYVTRLLSVRDKRGLHRQPVLRRHIAETLGVPRDWIERERLTPDDLPIAGLSDPGDRAAWQRPRSGHEPRGGS